MAPTVEDVIRMVADRMLTAFAYSDLRNVVLASRDMASSASTSPLFRLRRDVARRWMRRITSNRHPPRLGGAPAAVRDCRACIVAAIRRDRSDCMREGVFQKKSRKGSVIRLASKRLRDCADVVLEAIDMWPQNIQYASRRLRADPSIVLAAAKRVYHKEAAKVVIYFAGRGVSVSYTHLTLPTILLV